MKQTLSISPPIAVAKSDGNVTADGAHTHGKFRHYITDYQGNNTAVVSDSGAILEQTAYFPYGEPFREPSHPYTFSDNERLHAGGQNQYDFHARRLIPTLLRFDCPDPLMEKYPHLSPYLYCAGNPIMFTDKEGLEFTEQAEKHVRRLEYRVSSMLRGIDKDIDKYNKKLSEEGLSEEKRIKLEKKKKRAEAKKESLKQVTREIDILRSSSQLYDIFRDNSENRGFAGSEEINFTTSYENNTIIIRLGSDEISFLAHELKHAYQFEMGEFSFGGRAFADFFDEEEAYKRGELFGGDSKGLADQRYNKLQKDTLNAKLLGELYYNNDSLLQRYSDRKNAIFRWNNVTYRPKLSR